MQRREKVYRKNSKLKERRKGKGKNKRKTETFNLFCSSVFVFLPCTCCTCCQLLAMDCGCAVGTQAAVIYQSDEFTDS